VANRRIEEQLEALGRLRGVPSAEAAPALRKALADRVNLVAAKAANIAAELPAPELIPDLLRAFDRLFEDPVKRDPQCWGKNAIARALKDLGHRESPAFLRGAVHIQMEPVWGGQEDTAGPLRGICLLALPACPDLAREQVLRHMVNALTESSPTVRADAARALESGRVPTPLVSPAARRSARTSATIAALGWNRSATFGTRSTAVAFATSKVTVAVIPGRSAPSALSTVTTAV